MISFAVQIGQSSVGVPSTNRKEGVYILDHFCRLWRHSASFEKIPLLIFQSLPVYLFSYNRFQCVLWPKPNSLWIWVSTDLMHGRKIIPLQHLLCLNIIFYITTKGVLGVLGITQPSLDTRFAISNLAEHKFWGRDFKPWAPSWDF